MRMVLLLAHSGGLAPTNIPRRLRHLLGFIGSLCMANINRDSNIKLKHKKCKDLFEIYTYVYTELEGIRAQAVPSEKHLVNKDETN